MGMSSAPTTWVSFVAQDKLPGRFSIEADRTDRYRISGIVPIQGGPPALLRPGMELARFESGAPIAFESVPAGEGRPILHFRGVLEHLHYTGREEREELKRLSCAPPSGETTAVVILIGKSKAWWEMSQEERRTLFQKTGREGHHSIGLEYADRIYRRLYHARYLDPSAPYDFITYFEFESIRTEAFRALLSKLRDPRRNPEWRHVDFECEIWMTKLSLTEEPALIEGGEQCRPL